jgi:hypothetical protein
LQGLSAAARRIWEVPAHRRRIIRELLDAEVAGDAVRMRQGLGQIDAAVTEALTLLGLPRGPINGPFAVHTNAYAGIKGPDCTLEMSVTSMRAIVDLERGSDSTIRTWIHESIHGRRSYADDHLAEYRMWSGYEEGLAEGLARFVTRDRGGLDPFQPTYNYHVTVYETLAEAAGIDYVELLRALWQQPAGRVRSALVDAVDDGRRAKSLSALTDAQRGVLATVADNQLVTENSLRVPSRQVILTLWRRGFR